MEKKLDLERKRLQANYPAADIEVWAMDEHRLGLKPVERRVWVQQGEQPIAAVNWCYQWLWLYGFVHPESGETYWWILSKVNIPSHSPELQPAERLWPLTNEPIANRSFKSLDELEELLFHRCRNLLSQQDLISHLTFFHWWPRTIGATGCDRTPTIQVRCNRT